MAVAAAQTHCDRCQAALVPQAAYCERCGERTRRARRLVRIAIRAEVVFVLLIAAMTLLFAFVFYTQR